MFRSLYLTSALICLAIAPRCHGDLIIDIDSKQLDARSTGFVDVFIRNRTGDAPISIAGFDLSFRISDVSPAATPASGSLFFLNSFVPAAADANTRQSNSEQGLANYLLANLTTVDNFYATRIALDQLTTGDSSFSLNGGGSYTNISITDSPLLLARLEIGQDQAAATQLSRGTYSLTFDKNASQFYDATANPLSGQRFAAGQAGTVIVGAVPEPSSMLGLSMILTSIVIHRRRRKYPTPPPQLVS